MDATKGIEGRMTGWIKDVSENGRSRRESNGRKA
jgi:hypothetical protein